MTIFRCPKCNAEINPANINGLYYTCDNCGYLDDSTFDMIMSVATIHKEESKTEVTKE